ncbi:Uncharacterised protein [Staphylococcus saprophyticus]|nr:Uncharacterised protein [Staphylococcus saprophyticus]
MPNTWIRLNVFLQYVNDDAEYINFNGYKRDEKLKEEIRDAIQKFHKN